MTTVHVIAGLPASGKTSLARKIIAETGALRFNLDDARAMMGIGKESWSKEREDVAVATMLAGLKAATNAGYDTVVDNTHLVPRLPRLYRKQLGPLGVTFRVHDLTDVPVDECIERDRQRQNPVGDDVIRKLAARMADARKHGWRLTDKWMAVETAPDPKPYHGTPGAPRAVIFDLDGTLAINDGHRSPYDYTKVIDDSLCVSVAEIARTLRVGGLVLLYVSGRKAECRDDTIAWLVRHGLVQRPTTHLLMRRDGDDRPDYIVKRELFDRYIRDNYDVVGVFDDRDQVVTHCWRAMGIQCFQVAPGDF